MINQRLYDRLKKRFGSVHVLRPGIPLKGVYEEVEGERRRRLKVRRQGQGEEFRVSCPRCHDRRGRLYINHRWGVYDKKTKSRNLWLANCYNENCFAEYDEQIKLYDAIYGLMGMDTDDLNTKGVEIQRATELQEMELPGTVWPLSDMLKRSPKHHSLRYLRDRLIDPGSVAEAYDLSYCMSSHQSAAEARIIIPLKQEGVMVGWQGRYVGEPTTKSIPKYHTGAGTALTLIWYNADVALSYYTKVIVEGVMDAWSVGPQGMAIFNKNLGDDRMTTLKKLLRRYERIGNFVLLLDPDQSQKDIDRGQHHHMKIAMRAMLEDKMFRKRVLPVYLPSGTDPGSMDRFYIWALINAVAKKNGFKISSERIERKKRKFNQKCKVDPSEPRAPALIRS